MNARRSRSVVALVALWFWLPLGNGGGPHACLAVKPAPAVKKPQPVNLTGAYNAYLVRLQKKVGATWNVPDGKNHVVLQASVGSDGSVSEITLKSTPANKKAEEAANAAFAQAQPLEALPTGSPPTAKLTLNFDSSADPHGDSSSNISARLDPIQPPKSQPAGGQGATAQ